jgi:hypothetical protein
MSSSYGLEVGESRVRDGYNGGLGTEESAPCGLEKVVRGFSGKYRSIRAIPRVLAGRRGEVCGRCLSAKISHRNNCQTVLW